MGRVYCSTDKNLPRSVSKLFDTVAREIDEKGMLRRIAPVSEIKAAKAFNPDEEMIIEAIANLAKVDRWDEVIPPTAWGKRLGVYMKNPIILREHNRDWPIGTAESVTAKDDGLHYRACIGNPKAAQLTAMQIESRSLIAQGILRANSVGFIPHLIEWDEDEEVIRHTDVELLEISIVAIPMQQDSMITSVKAWRKGLSMPKANEKTEEGTDVAAITAIKSTVEECLQHAKGCYDILNKLHSEESKRLQDEIAALKTKNKELQDEVEALTKSSEELLETLTKQGLIKPEAA
jgi:HK97 family phage prohead protease